MTKKYEEEFGGAPAFQFDILAEDCICDELNANQPVNFCCEESTVW